MVTAGHKKSMLNNPTQNIGRWLLLLWVFMFLLTGQACRSERMADVVRVGLPDEPRTLNVWLASDANSRSVLRMIYQPLYERDPDTLEFVPWLASELPVYDPEALTYTVRLRQARWSDGQPLTSADVAFTGRVIMEFKPPDSSHWKYVTEIETPDAQTVVFHLKKPFATFLSRTLQVSIIPAHQWTPVVEAARSKEKPLAHLLRYENRTPVGSGPFTFKEWREGAYIYLERNPNFFGTGVTIAGRTLGPHINGILYKFYGTTDVAMLALRKGEIDIYQQHIQPGYLGILEKEKTIEVLTCEKSALYYLGFNARRPPFNDVNLRRAAALLINKDFIIERLLQNQGTIMWSIIPPGNTQWYNPELAHSGEGLERNERIRRAYALLSAAGYTWDTPPVNSQGAIVPARGLRLPDGSLMAPFTILTPPADYDPARAISGILIQEWLKALGMPASARPMEFSSLLQAVKQQHNFDAFVLGYGRLSLDPDYLRSFFHSSNDKERGWNMSGYHNDAFDALADKSQREMDPARRRQMINEMQQMIMEDVPYVPLYLPRLIEAVRRDHFKGWVPMLDGVGNRWTYCMIEPVNKPDA